MTPAPPAPGPPRPSSASPPGAAPRRREGERGPRAAGEAAEMGTEWVAQKATPSEGEAPRNRELGAWRGPPAGAHMSGKWQRRLRVGCRAEAGRARTGSSETRREGDGELGEGAVGEGAREEGGREEGGEGRGEAKGGPLRRRAGGLPREGGGRAGAAARAGPRRLLGTLGASGRRNGEGGGGGASRRARRAGPGWPPPPRGRGLLAAKERGRSCCRRASHSDGRHFTAQRAPSSSSLPSSSSPLTVLPAVTRIHFPGTDGPSARSRPRCKS